jgi:2,3-bisphosphoglycerate-dependent phosphoglycerate mutase
MARLVLLRHGESTANAGDVFAGWLDMPLTDRGVEEVRAAGRGLAALQPDSIHTSVLGRAINTAHLLAASAGWRAPVRRDWRLNERHYGALQGMARDVARRRYGHADVEAWRRSVDVAPPPASAYALAEQLSDRRYQDAPEARLIRSESLSDVAARMTPYWRDVLAPELAAGRVVVVVSHGNALRVLLHLAAGTPLAETARAQVPTAMPITPRVALPVP